MSEYSGRVKAIKLHGLLHIDGSRSRVGGHDLAEFLLIQGVQRVPER